MPSLACHAFICEKTPKISISHAALNTVTRPQAHDLAYLQHKTCAPRIEATIILEPKS